MFLNSDGIIGTTFDSCIISNNQAFRPKNKKKFMREKSISTEKYYVCMYVCWLRTATCQGLLKP